MKAIRFKVEGVGRFPIDMLRYDQCFPDTQEDSVALMEHNNSDLAGRRQVTVVRYADRKTWFPTEGRWESFGWRVLPETVEAS